MQLCLPIALVLSSAVVGLAGDVAPQQIDGGSVVGGTWDGHQELWARPDVTIGEKIEFAVGAILAKHDHGRRLLDLHGLAESVDSAVDFNNAGVTDGKHTGSIAKKASAGQLFNTAIMDAHNGDVAEAQDVFSHAKGLAAKSLSKTGSAVGHKNDAVQNVRDIGSSSTSAKAQECLTRLADWLDGTEFGDVIHNNHGDAHHMKGQFDTESSFTSSLCSAVSNAADDMADMSQNVFNAGVHFMMR